MIFLATASGLMMERVRSTAILALRPNKCGETQNYIMGVEATRGARASKTCRTAGLQKQRRVGARLSVETPIGLVLARCYELDSTRSTNPITSGPRGGEATQPNSTPTASAPMSATSKVR